ncbi:MAG: hypothetical protein R2882_05760 [Gemmatimonadales bacterium]
MGFDLDFGPDGWLLFDLLRRLFRGDETALTGSDGAKTLIVSRESPGGGATRVMTTRSGPIGWVHPPAAAPAPDFPAEVPFVRGLPVLTADPDPAQPRLMVWFDVRDLEDCVERVTDACRRAGWWVMRDQTNPDGEPRRHVSFQRGDTVRILTTMPGPGTDLVALTELRHHSVPDSITVSSPKGAPIPPAVHEPTATELALLR